VVQRESLHHNILAVLDSLARAGETQGDYEQARQYASRQIALEPWREEAHRQLMRVLALNGQRAEALAQYDTCARILEEELGVEPAPETADLRQQIADNNLQSSTVKATPQLHHFPAQFTPFVGRETELSQITLQLAHDDCRLLTLIGPGGMGKTRLSIEAAKKLADSHHFADGLYFVGLTAVTHPSHLISAIAHSLGLTFDEREEPQAQLIKFLTDKQVLLVLDNFEHLLTSDALGLTPRNLPLPKPKPEGSNDAATIVGELLTAVPSLKLLITSREALNLRAEQRFMLEGLAVPDTGLANEIAAYSAIQLFMQAAGQVQPGFGLADEVTRTAVIHICQLVQGVPLAVEMAASWVRLMDCPTIAQEIQRSLDFLTTSLRDVPERHRSMRAVFEESWRLLSIGEQRTLAQAAYFRGGFDLQTALKIMDTSMGDLTALLDKSLLRRGAGNRYTLHELLRQFAMDKLGEMGATAVAQKHSQFYLQYLADIGSQFHGENPRQARTAVQTDSDNIRQAWQWALSHSQYEWLAPAIQPLSTYFHLAGLTAEGEALMAEASQIVPATHALILSQLQVQQANFLGVQGKYDEAMTAVQSALTLAQQQNAAPHIATAQNMLGDLYQRQGEYEAALAQFQQALDYWQTADDPIAHIASLHGVGVIYFHKGEYDTSLPYYERSLELAKQHRSQLNIARSVVAIGLIYQYRGEFDKADSYYEQSLAIEEALDNQQGIAHNTSALGVVQYKQGNYDAALRYYQRALEINRRLGQKESIASVRGNMGNIYYDQGNYDESLRSQREALQVDRELGNKRGITIRQNNIGLNLWRKGQYEPALQTYAEALTIAQEIQFKPVISVLVGNMGVVELDRGNYEAALAYDERALQVDRELGNKEGIARNLGNIGTVYRQMGELEKALIYYDQAIPLHRQLGTKYHLCETLIRKAQLLFGQGHLVEANQLHVEGSAIAVEVGRQDTLYQAGILEAQLLAVQGEKTAVYAKLQTMLDNVQSDEERAGVHYELWRLMGERVWGETAVTLYQQLAQTTPNILYQTRLAELSDSLNSGRTS
jgi:tetratricopeptide (TPR) repeat protein